MIKMISTTRGSRPTPPPELKAYADWNRMSVSIDLDIQDCDKAIQVYEKFYEQLSPLTKGVLI